MSSSPAAATPRATGGPWASRPSTCAERPTSTTAATRRGSFPSLFCENEHLGEKKKNTGRKTRHLSQREFFIRVPPLAGKKVPAQTPGAFELACCDLLWHGPEASAANRRAVRGRGFISLFRLHFPKNNLRAVSFFFFFSIFSPFFSIHHFLLFKGFCSSFFPQRLCRRPARPVRRTSVRAVSTSRDRRAARTAPLGDFSCSKRVSHMRI